MRKEEAEERRLLGLALALLVAVLAEEFDRTLPGAYYRGTGQWMPAAGDPLDRSRESHARIRRIAVEASRALGLDHIPDEPHRFSHASLQSELALFKNARWWPKVAKAWKDAEGIVDVKPR